MKIALNKLNVELPVTVRDVEQKLVDWYIKGTERSLTMSGTTVRDHYLTYQLAWYLATQTGAANLLLKLVEKHVLKL